MKKKILIIGAGGHAKSCIEVISRLSNFTVAGLVGFPQEVGKNITGVEVIGSDKDLENLSKKYEFAVIGLGWMGDEIKRARLAEKLKSFNFKIPKIISPTATISEFSKIGAGSFIFNNVYVNTETKISKNCIINSNSLIEHDVLIGSNCHLSTGVIINGEVSIGKNTFIGSGSIIRNKVNIGSNSFVGMGEIVTSDLPINSRFIGGKLI